MNPLVCNMNPYKTCASILLEGNIKGFNQVINLLNMYAPYKDKRTFLENIESSGLLNLQNLILDGDLNFTMHSFEYWRMQSSMDSLCFLKIFFHRNKLVDIVPHKLSPT